MYERFFSIHLKYKYVFIICALLNISKCCYHTKRMIPKFCLQKRPRQRPGTLRAIRTAFTGPTGALSSMIQLQR